MSGILGATLAALLASLLISIHNVSQTQRYLNQADACLSANGWYTAHRSEWPIPSAKVPARIRQATDTCLRGPA